MRLLALFLLTSCATPYSELMHKAMNCGDADECQEIWDEINERDEAEVRREKEKNRCPIGYTYLSGHFGGDGCVSALEMRRILR